MYDISSEKFFNNLDKWISMINQLANDIPLILTENKIDLVNKRKISTEKGEQFANGYNIDFFESSRLKGVSAGESFLWGNKYLD